jgi:hypothetical protein
MINANDNDNEEPDFTHISVDCGMVADGHEVYTIIAEEVVLEALTGSYGRTPAEVRERQTKDANELRERILAEIEAALSFYANPSDYKAPFTGGGGSLYFDCGEVARKALSLMQKRQTTGET